MKLTIDGDMAWLGCEGIFPLRSIGKSGTGSETWRLDKEAPLDRFRLRATEIYQRDDGEGRPVWKMWHFHCSPLPPETETRPAFTDTPGKRGLGGNFGPLHSASSGSNDSGGSQWRGKIATSELRRPRFARRRTRDKCDEERPSSYRGCRDDDLVFARSRFRVHSAGQLIIREAA